VSAIRSLPRLGVGVLYNPALPEFLREHLDAVDFVSVMPDMFQIDRGVGSNPRYIDIEDSIAMVDWLTKHRPLVAHNISMSIGSADLFDTEYIEQIARWHRRCHFAWHSDHLAFVQVGGHDGAAHNVGLAAPVPYDHETLALIAGRVARVQGTVPVPFLLENNVYYVQIPDQDMSEPTFLNRVAELTDCGLLLDLHNLYANARNHDFDPLGFIDELDLGRVVEVHIAGGNELAGMYTDSHAGPCPEPVWDLLEQVVPRAENLCGITFEFHESYYPLLTADGVRAELQRARATWQRHH
jgi:uncharacterized protein